MAEISTLSYIADIVISRALAEAPEGADVSKIVEEAYPFEDSIGARRVWIDALIRHALYCNSGVPRPRKQLPT